MNDADLVLIDGTINLTGNTDTPAVSTTRDETFGSAVIDLGTGGTPADGLVAVLILPTAAIASSTLTGFIEVSDSEDMTAETNDVHEMGKFDIAAEDKGIITASEVTSATVPLFPWIRFATKKRYVRANLTVNGTTQYSFYLVKCYLTPYLFPVP